MIYEGDGSQLVPLLSTTEGFTYLRGNTAFHLLLCGVCGVSLGDTGAAAGQHLRKHGYRVDKQAVAEVDQTRRAWHESVGAPFVDGVPVQGLRMCEAYACFCGFVTSSETRKRLHQHKSGDAAPSWEACSAQQLAFSTSLQRVRPAAGPRNEC